MILDALFAMLRIQECARNVRRNSSLMQESASAVNLDAKSAQMPIPALNAALELLIIPALVIVVVKDVNNAQITPLVLNASEDSR